MKKQFEEEYVTLLIDMKKLIINIWIINDKNKELPYLKYWDVNNLYRWPISQMVPVNNFKWVEHISEFDEIFIKSYNEESKEKYFLEIDIQYHENLHQTQSNLLFLLERMKIEKVEKLVANLHGKSECELKNNSVFGKTVKNVWKHRNVRLVTIERRRTIWYQNQIIIAKRFS